MLRQVEIDFTTTSPINVDRLTGQNKRLYDYLIAGNKITCFDPAKTMLKIGYLNSRVSDLVNKNKVSVQSKYVEVEVGGEKVMVKQYWIE